VQRNLPQVGQDVAGPSVALLMFVEHQVPDFFPFTELGTHSEDVNAEDHQQHTANLTEDSIDSEQGAKTDRQIDVGQAFVNI
jgi:hypothetical protein